MSSINVILISSYFDQIKSSGPRCLNEVDGVSILDRQLNIINTSFPESNIVIISGQFHRKLKKLTKKYDNVLIVENPQPEKTNELSIINLGLEYISQNCLILRDDLIFKHNIFNKFIKYQSQIFLSQIYQSDIGCILDKNKVVQNMSWGLPTYWTEISYFCNKEFNLLRELSSKEFSRNWFLFEGINNIVKEGGSFLGNVKKSKVIKYER